MKQFEYKSKYYPTNTYSEWELLDDFNKLGLEGWEIINVIVVIEGNSGVDILFKREI